jgi:NDP-4-keto-2,6-dideoxyhexose 3-C-methyltransferase
MNCRNCKKNLKIKIINIGNQCISSVFPKKIQNNLKKYPLDLFICNFCELVQFKKTPPFQDMYGLTYGYYTSLSPLMIKHIKEKFKFINKQKFLKNRSYILDIGSNDGTFLNFFSKKNKNFNLYGIDPSAIKFKKYYEKNINLIVDYFSKESLNNIDNKFDLITSFAMFYDIEDPNKFCSDINYLLDKNGVWMLELSYFPLLLKNLTYDQICHEHLCYYTLRSFNKIISKHNLQILDFSFNEINGGSVEIICAKKNSVHKPKTEKIKEQLLFEKTINYNSYNKFNERIENTKKTLNFILSKINKREIIAYGASTKGNIVLNHCEINNKQIKYICDANAYKYNRYTPGSNLKIISKKEMRLKKPKYLLVLIWSFRKEVIKQEINFLKKGGKLIFHLPILHIVDKKNYKKFLKSDLETFSYDL